MNPLVAKRFNRSSARGGYRDGGRTGLAQQSLENLETRLTSRDNQTVTVLSPRQKTTVSDLAIDCTPTLGGVVQRRYDNLTAYSSRPHQRPFTRDFSGEHVAGRVLVGKEFFDAYTECASKTDRGVHPGHVATGLHSTDQLPAHSSPFRQLALGESNGLPVTS
jgi:hypothetical protein